MYDKKYWWFEWPGIGYLNFFHWNVIAHSHYLKGLVTVVHISIQYFFFKKSFLHVDKSFLSFISITIFTVRWLLHVISESSQMIRLHATLNVNRIIFKWTSHFISTLDYFIMGLRYQELAISMYMYVKSTLNIY